MDPYAANAWYQETISGNGPVKVHMDQFNEQSGEFFHFHAKARKRLNRMEDIAGYPRDREWYEVFPGVISEMSAIRVGHSMQTDVAGLFAAGDAAGAGSARAGAVPAPPAKIHGTGLMNALFMGSKSGESAALLADVLRKTSLPYELPQEELDLLRTETYACMDRESGISPYDVIHRVQDAMAPCDFIFVKSGERMQEALDIVAQARTMLPEMRACNYHELSKCVDAQAMVLCAEMFFRTSLERKESRGFHLREDYPEQDSRYCCWLNVRKDGDDMVITREEIRDESCDYPWKSE